MRQPKPIYQAGADANRTPQGKTKWVPVVIFTGYDADLNRLSPTRHRMGGRFNECDKRADAIAIATSWANSIKHGGTTLETFEVGP